MRTYRNARVATVAAIVLSGSSSGIEDSFERFPQGAFSRLTAAYGVWTSEGQSAVIHAAHRRSGKQCLRLLGGKASSCVLTLAGDYRKVHQVSFWAERWTRAKPFRFRIERGQGEKRYEIYTGDKGIRIGGFRTRVVVDVNDTIDRLRFTCTSPEHRGIMIDDLTISRPKPMEFLSASAFPRLTPVLIGNPVNPVVQVRIEADGSLRPLRLTELRVDTTGTTDLDDVAKVGVYYTGTNGELSFRDPKKLFAHGSQFGDAQRPAAELIFSGEQALSHGVNHFWISFTLSDSANQDHRIDAACTRVSLSDGRSIEPTIARPSVPRRIGVALRNAGDDGARSYRIPGLATTSKDTLIAVYDIRWLGWGDLPNHIDVGMSRSTDGGRTWEPMKVIMNMGDDPKWRYDGIGDPAILVDRANNTIWVAALWSHGNQSWNGSGPGLDPADTGQLILAKSEDDGKTWSEPINITRQIKDPMWCLLLQGPGRGITMRDGTLVFPAQYQAPPDQRRLPRSTIIYSRDHGHTWQIGTGAYDDTTEAAVVELPDGSLMLNCRYNRTSRREVAITRDLGRTWTEHPTSRLSLPEPGRCQGSLIHVDHELGKDVGGWLLFSNPNVESSPRRHMTIKASRDQGLTWPKEHQILLDEGASAGYSCLSMIDETTVGILYEGSVGNMTFQRIPLSDIIGPAPKPSKGSLGKLQVFVLTGQSNSLGTTADPKESDISPGTHPADRHVRFFWANRSTRGGDGHAVLYGTSDGQITTLKMQQGEGCNPAFWGPEFGFARGLYERSHRDFMIVKASRGGGGNSFWVKGSRNDHMYRHVVATVRAALAALPEGTDYEIRALLYLQGESDSLSEAELADQRLAKLAENLGRDLPHGSNLRVVIAGIAPSGQKHDLVRAKHAALAQRDPTIAYFDNTDLHPGLYDSLRFNKPAKLIIGRRFANAWTRLGERQSPRRSGSRPHPHLSGRRRASQ